MINLRGWLIRMISWIARFTFLGVTCQEGIIMPRLYAEHGLCAYPLFMQSHCNGGFDVAAGGAEEAAGFGLVDAAEMLDQTKSARDQFARPRLKIDHPV